MRSKEEIIKFLKERLAELLNIPESEIQDDAPLVEDLGTTSIMIVDLFVSVDDEFGVNMQDRLDLASPVTLNDIAENVLDGLEGRGDSEVS